MIKRYLLSPSLIFLIATAVTVGLLLGVSSVWLPPLWAFGAFLAALLLSNMFRRPEIFVLLYLVMTSSIFSQTKGQSVSIGFGTVYLTDVLLMLSFGLMIARKLVEPKFKFVRTPLDWPILVFVGVSFISTFIAIYGGSLTFNESLGEIRIVASYLLFFAVTNLVRDKPQLTLLIKGFLLLATIVAIVSILQYLSGGSITFLAGRLETLSPTSGVFRIIPPGQSMLLVAFLTVFSFLVIEKTKVTDVFRLVQIGLLGLAILMTYFRASWAMTVINVLLIGFLSRYQERQRLLLWIFVIVLSVAVVLSVVMQESSSRGARFVQSTFDRFGSLYNASEYTSPTSSLRWRDFEYRYAIPQILSNPIGLGLGARYRPFTPPFDWEGYDGRRYIHNGYLWVLMKSGWLASLGLMWFLFGILIRGLRYWRSISEPYLRAIVLAFALCSLTVMVVNNVESYVMNAAWAPVIVVTAAINEIILGRFSQASSKDQEEHLTARMLP